MISSINHNGSMPDISRYIQNRLFEPVDPDDERVEQAVRFRIKCVSAVVSIIAQIPFMSLAANIAGDNNTYAGFLMAGNLVSFGGFNNWATAHALEDICLPLTRDERALLQDRLTLLAKSVVCFVGIMGQVPLAYATYDHSGNYIYPAIVMLCRPGSSIYSLMLSAKKFRRVQRDFEGDARILRCRQMFINTLMTSHSQLIKSGAKNWGVHLNLLSQIGEDAHLLGRDKVARYMHRALEVSPTINEPEVNSSISMFGKIVGGVIAVAELWLFYQIGAHIGANLEGKSELDRSPAQIGIGSFMVGCNAYLYFSSSISATSGLFNKVYGWFRGEDIKSEIHYLAPRLDLSLSLVSLGSVALSYGLSVYLARTYFDTKWQIGLQEVLLPTGMILIILNAMTEIISDIVEMSAQSKENMQGIIRLRREHKRFIRMLDRSPLLEFVKFIRALPIEDISEVLQRAKISSEDLDVFITNKENMGSSEYLLA